MRTILQRFPEIALAFIGGKIGDRILLWLERKNQAIATDSPDEYEDAAHKLKIHFGEDVFNRASDRTILDFGSGAGREVIEFAKQGAKNAIGVELREKFRASATKLATDANVSNCQFVERSNELADVVYSLDSFEHFEDPAFILSLMSDLVKDDGEIWISFSWTWYHPYGGHLFSVFPWAHLVFSEDCLIRWRARFKDDGATRFSEVSGGLNQMTIDWFEKLIESSNLEFIEKRICPIRPLRWMHNRLTREFTTSLISAKLRKAPSQVSADETLGDRQDATHVDKSHHAVPATSKATGA